MSNKVASTKVTKVITLTSMSKIVPHLLVSGFKYLQKNHRRNVSLRVVDYKRSNKALHHTHHARPPTANYSIFKIDRNHCANNNLKR